MTTVATSYCGACGAANYGTRFCESCGAAAQTAAPPPAQSDPPPDRLDQPSRVELSAGMPETTLRRLRWTALALYGANLVLETIDILAGGYFYIGGAIGLALSVLLLGGSGALSVVAAFGGWASSARRTAAGLAAVAFLVLSLGLVLSGSLGAYSDLASLNISQVLGTIVAPALGFASWGLSRPFHGPGWFGGLLALVGGGILVVVLRGIALQQYWDSYGGAAADVLFRIGAVLSVLVIALAVLLAWSMENVAFAGTRQRHAMLFPAAPAAPANRSAAAAVAPVDAGRTNTLALLSMIFGLLGGSVVPIVLGFVALSQIRRTGEQGRGMAIAGVVLGFIAAGVLLILLIVYIVIVIRASTYSGYYY